MRLRSRQAQLEALVERERERERADANTISTRRPVYRFTDGSAAGRFGRRDAYGKVAIGIQIKKL